MWQELVIACKGGFFVAIGKSLPLRAGLRLGQVQRSRCGRRRRGDGSTMNEPDPERSPPSGGLGFSRRLRRARMALGWSQLGLARRMCDVGVDYGGTATIEALKGMISKWETGKKVPNQANRHLLAETLGATVGSLGLTVDPDYVWRKTAWTSSGDDPQRSGLARSRTGSSRPITPGRHVAAPPQHR